MYSMMNKTKLIKQTGIHKLFKPFYGGIGHAIMFHRVYNDNKKLITGGLQVTTDYLEQVITYYKNNDIDIVSLDEFYKRITSKEKSKRFVTFTFDDGYLDNLTHALPVFEKYNAPFSVFVCTGYIDKTAFLWWYLLEEIMFKQNQLRFCYNNQEYNFKTETEEEKRVAFGKIKTLILECTNLEDYNALMQLILEGSDVMPFELNEKLILNLEQTKQLSDHPLVTLGAHTFNHMALSAMSIDDVYSEIQGSMVRLKEITGKNIEYFAYPYGTTVEAGEREFEIASKCNLKMAFTTQRRNISRKQSENLFSIPRVGINPRMEMDHIDLYMSGFSVFKDSLSSLSF